jgi:hypothetical protein
MSFCICQGRSITLMRCMDRDIRRFLHCRVSRAAPRPGRMFSVVFNKTVAASHADARQTPLPANGRAHHNIPAPHHSNTQRRRGRDSFHASQSLETTHAVSSGHLVYPSIHDTPTNASVNHLSLPAFLTAFLSSS